MKNHLRTGLLLVCLFLLGLLMSCGGGGSSSDSSADSSVSQSTGTVGVLLTDNPADLSLFSAVNATIEAVSLMGADAEEPIVLYSDLNVTYDLLQLRNQAVPLLFADDIPTGSYCKIRLTLSDLELVMADGSGSEHPRLTGNKKVDLLARDCFEVRAGEIRTLQIDIDAGNSIHINSNKKGYNFRPVVFIDVLGDDFVPRLVRIQGEITEVNEGEGTLLICGAVPAPATDDPGCVEVQVGEDAAFFDNAENAGAPQPLSELFSKTGETVTVVGWPQHDVPPYGELDDSYHPYMKLDALTVMLGDFLQVDGEVLTAADTSGFTMTVLPEQPVAEGGLPVQFYEDSAPVNGTRIVARSGELLTTDDVVTPLAVQVDGVLTEAEDALNAALVIVDRDSAVGAKIAGSILSLGEGDSFILTPDSETVCGSPVSEVEVIYSADTTILSVTLTDAESLVEHGGSLAVDQTVGVSGYCAAEGFSAVGIVIVDDQTTTE